MQKNQPVKSIRNATMPAIQIPQGQQRDPNDKRKRIIAYKGDRSACFYYRLFNPLVKLATNHKEEYDVSITGVLDVRQIGVFDIAILQRQYDPKVFQGMLEMKKMGQKIVYEIDDDLFNIPDWNPAKRVLGVRSVQENIRYFLSNVDAMFVATEPLAELYKEYCKNIYVLPNSIDFEKFYPSTKNSAKRVVCWQGSMTHEKDLSLMLPGLERLAKDPDVFVKMWCGFNEKTKRPLFDVPGAYTVPLVPFECFYSMFNQIDGYIGLAPVTSLPFNKGKSNLKFLEYTAQGMVTIASNFGPYAKTIEDGETGILISDNTTWYMAIRDLLDDQEKYNRILNNAQELVKTKYNIASNYLLWKNAIDDVLKQ